MVGTFHFTTGMKLQSKVSKVMSKNMKIRNLIEQDKGVHMVSIIQARSTPAIIN